MSLNTIRQIIETRIADEFQDIPVYFGNQQIKPPNDRAWLWCAVNFSDASYETLDGLDFVTGLAQANVFAPVASGTGLGLAIGDRLKYLFNRVKASGVYFRPANGPRTVAQEATSAWNQMAVSIQFVADLLAGGDMAVVPPPPEPGSDINSDNFVYSFGWGDANPVKIFTLPAGQVLMSCLISIRTAFDSNGSTIQVGTALDPDLFMGSNQSLPTLVDEYNSYPFYKSTTSTDVWLTITPGGGNTQGTGLIILSLSD